MTKKYNNKSEFFKDWTTKKLKDYCVSLDDSIHGENACYGTKDLFMLDGIQRELENRNIVISSKLIFNN